MGNKCVPKQNSLEKLNYVSLDNKNKEGDFESMPTAEVLKKLFEYSKREDMKNIQAHSLEKNKPKYIYCRGGNMFASAARTAFTAETDFVFNPDDIWLLISQGFGHYINKNSEALRGKIVDFQGKKQLEIVRKPLGEHDDPIAYWENTFPEFSQKIEEYIGEELHSALISNFSTTGPIQKIASEIILMYSMQNYFSYGVGTLCGIQGFKIEGKVKDWENMKEKVSSLKKYGKAKWLSCVEQIIGKIIKQLKGEETDKKFWNNFYKWEGHRGSGGTDKVTGWIVNFFPYLKHDGQLVENKQSEIPWNKKKTIRDERYSPGMCTCPFTLDSVPMRFLAGFVGAEQRGKYVRPVQGWLVLSGEEPNSGADDR